MSGPAAAAPRGTGGARAAGPRPRRPGTLLMAGSAGVVAVFLGLPVLVLVVRGVGGLGDPGQDLTSLAGALRLSLFTTAISLTVTVLAGTPLALWLARRPPRGAAILETLIDLPIVLPPAVAGLALLLVFGRRGVLGEPLGVLGLEIPFTTLAVIFAQVFVAAPFYIRSARSGFRAVDRDLEDAARVDGGGELAVFRTVTVPLAGSALAAGMVMTWARALGEFGATILFAGSIAGTTETLPLLVYAEFGAGRLETAITAATALVGAAIAVLAAVRLLRARSVGALGGVD